MAREYNTCIPSILCLSPKEQHIVLRNPRTKG
jgi:hypothetical protein